MQVAGHDPSAGDDADSVGEHGSGSTRSRIPPVLVARNPTSKNITSRFTSSRLYHFNVCPGASTGAR